MHQIYLKSKFAHFMHRVNGRTQNSARGFSTVCFDFEILIGHAQLFVEKYRGIINVLYFMRSNRGVHGK